MSYNESLANQVREALMHLPKVEEKQMFQGLTFMVDDKMCVGVREDEIMFRVNPEMHNEVIEPADDPRQTPYERLYFCK